MKIRDRLAALRAQMEAHDLHAYLVPSTDAHQSEYVPDCWQRRAWITGFTGSAGDALVLRDRAGLWTDGRYFLQAESELKGTGVKLFRMGQPKVPDLAEFLADTLEAGQAVGVDPRLVSPRRAASLARAVQRVGAELRLLDTNLVDAVWEDQPPRSAEPVRILSTRFAGETTARKLKRVRAEMAEVDADAHVLTTLDAIAWLFNIRGRDVEFNPVVLAYAIVTPEAASLYIDEGKLDARTRKQLGRLARLRPYDAFAGDLKALDARKGKVWVDPDSASAWVVDRLSRSQLHRDPSPILRMKAAKNATEVAGMVACHERDGAAMVRFLRWLEEAVPRGGVTEISAADRLEEFRREGDHFQGLSFRTISGYAAHGAIIHYTVNASTDIPLRPRGIYLVDSGAQYLDGTTDITRTILLGGKATREQKDRFTRVLKGHIALARARFPEGVRGMRLDTLARLPLWEAGLDYHHGTGHGVGSYLNVHEGPQSISSGRCNGVPLEPGNVQSNEPGFYRDGAYGIRIENLMVVEEDEDLTGDYGQFLRFHTLTLCPIDHRLVDARMLSPEEIRWWNDYHRRVRRTLSPYLGTADRRWLREACVKL